MIFPIVAKRFSGPEFNDYLGGLALSAFKPDMVVLHNTAVPTLKDRPSGFTAENMADLERYYADVQGWSGGPHLFVDQNGIWVFNPLDRRGVHSPSWNARSWGVEMLGDYEAEGFDSGPGLLVRRNAVPALAAMFRRLGLQPTDDHLKLHKEDPRTTHVCPGKHVDKGAVRSEVLLQMARTATPKGAPAKVVVYRKGMNQAPAAVIDATILEGATMVDAAAWNAASLGTIVKGVGPVSLRSAVGSRYDLTFNAQTMRVYAVERAT